MSNRDPGGVEWVLRAYKFRLTPDDVEGALIAQGHGCRALWNLLHDWYLQVTENRPRATVPWAGFAGT